MKIRFYNRNRISDTINPRCHPLLRISVNLCGHFITGGIQRRYVLETYIEFDKSVNRKSVSRIFIIAQLLLNYTVD
jgi:hypothetical protein